MGFQDRGYWRPPRDRFATDWTAVVTIIIVTIAVWVANLVGTADLFRETLPLRFSLNDVFSLHSDLPQHLLTHFWQLLTYGFLHDGPSLEFPGGAVDPWHLVGNMLMLWFFGREVEAILGRAEFVRFYCVAIVIAGITWLVAAQFGGQGGRLVGASGGVMAVLALFIWYFPNQTVYLMGVLEVPVWALGLLYVVMDFGGAFGGRGDKVAHLAHLGGAAFGILYAWRSWNLAALTELPGRLLHARPRVRVFNPQDDSRGHRASTGDDGDERLQEEVDRILAKISRVGEAGLTASERDTLTRASRRLKDRSR